MKKTMMIVLAALMVLFCLTACAEETVPAPTLRFVEAEEGLPVMQLEFSEEGGCVTAAGVLRGADRMLCLTGQYLNGTANETADGYLYAAPEALSTLQKRENVDGILLYWGHAYGVAVTNEGVQTVYTLDDTLKARSWTEFYNQALRWQQENSETSGGTGFEE